MTNPKRNWLKGAFHPLMKHVPNQMLPAEDGETSGGGKYAVDSVR
jgi:hypothetical protein